VATELFLKGKTEAQIEQFRGLAPLERLARPDDIADVVSFLAGPAASSRSPAGTRKIQTLSRERRRTWLRGAMFQQESASR
jgi:NAD(P)-dependent dehydrogenase (short-subunit alcohol dehydrogenase family)